MYNQVNVDITRPIWQLYLVPFGSACGVLTTYLGEFNIVYYRKDKRF